MKWETSLFTKTRLLFSDRYLNFWSQHPVSQKIGTIGLIDRVVLLSNLKFYLDILFHYYSIVKELSIELYIWEIIRINNCLKKIIMASNRKSVVNNNTCWVEVEQSSVVHCSFCSWYYWEEFSGLNSEHIRIVL